MEQRNLRIQKPIGHNNNSFICWNFGSFTSISLAKDNDFFVFLEHCVPGGQKQVKSRSNYLTHGATQFAHSKANRTK